MRQVPVYLIAGNGRVARHIAHYFSSIGISFQQWDRRQPLSALLSMAQESSHVLLLVRDDAIEGLARFLKDVPALKVHFSGSLVTPHAFGAHPLMTFGETPYAQETYRNIFFVIDKDAPEFERILPGLSNPHARIDQKDKARYHALCVMAGNFSCLLWQKLFSALEGDFGIPAQAAQGYLRQQTENLLNDYKTALTGPFARGDFETIARNINALQEDEFQDVYRAFARMHAAAKKEKVA